MDIEVGEETEMLLKDLNSLEATKELKNVKLLRCSCTALRKKASFGFSKFKGSCCTTSIVKTNQSLH